MLELGLWPVKSPGDSWQGKSPNYRLIAANPSRRIAHPDSGLAHGLADVPF